MKIIVEDIVNQYSNMLIQIAYQKTFNMSDAEDIAQEVFMKLLDNQEKIQNEKHLKAWLIRVTVNLSNDYHKKFWNKNTQGIEENDAIYTEENDKINIFDEVKKLTPPIYRDIVYLYFYQGYKIVEIANLLNLSKNTVSSALTRSKEKLRNILKEGDFYE